MSSAREAAPPVPAPPPAAVSVRLPRTIGGNAVLLGALGVSQVAFEYLLSGRVAAADFERYVTLRNLALVFMAVAPLGLNEVMVRRGAGDRGAAVRLLRVAYGVTAAWALGLLLFPMPLAGEPGPLPRGGIVACLLAFSLCQSVSNFHRSQGRFVLALFLRDGWRALLWASLAGLALFGTAAEGVAYTFAAVLGGVALAGVLALARVPGDGGPAVSGAEARLGVAFWLTMVSLTSMTYADQLLLERLARAPGELKTYALAVAVVMMPFTLLGSAAGAVLLPSIAGGRRIRPRLGAAAASLAGARGMAAAAGGVAALALYYAAARLLLERVGAPLTPAMFCLLAGIGTLRVLYALPSSVVGAVGTPGLVAGVGGLECAVVAVQIPATVLLYRLLGMHGVALATLGAWTLRLAVGAWGIRRLPF